MQNIKRIRFVSGVFKSGTSLLAEFYEEQGYFNPSRITNPDEYGFGTCGQRYLTRECALARILNISLIEAATKIKSADKAIRSYLSCLDEFKHPQIVIKAPHFVHTLPLWLGAAQRLSIRVEVALAQRNEQELDVAWRGAPWTKQLLADDPGALAQWLSAQKSMMAFLTAQELHCRVFAFENLIERTRHKEHGEHFNPSGLEGPGGFRLLEDV